MKSFTLLSIANVQALRPSLIELRGHPVGLPAVSSSEPLLRGCDQREWLEKLAARGIRHLIVPLNGVEEDTCLYARRHPAPAAGGARQPALFDLSHRDEGFFARLQFLVQTADALGIMLGLSLIDLGAPHGPFCKNENEQGVSFEEFLAPVKRGHTVTISSRRNKIEDSLNLTIEWLAAQLRGRSGMWIELFRGDDRLDESLQLHAPALAQLEQRLTKRLAEALTRSGEDTHRARMGPWVVVRDGYESHAGDDKHLAPFGVRHQAAAGQFIGPDYLPARRVMRRPLMCWINATKHKNASRAALWRAVMRGCWPIVPAEHCVWSDLTQLACFCRQWTSGGYLRPCPEILDKLPADAVVDGKVSAASDGAGRYFVFLSDFKSAGLKLTVLPGTYRYYWFDVATGKGFDYGDGVNGPDCRLPRTGNVRDLLLILEQEELPEPLVSW